VLLPTDNAEDWEELNDDIKKALSVHFVESAGEAFEILFPKNILAAKKPGKPKKRSLKDGVL
jgi:ATP-dependent Lon protease